MNPKKRTTIWLLLGALVFLIAVFYPFHTGDLIIARQSRDMSDLRQLALILVYYANDNEKYPDSLTEILDAKYTTNIKYMQDITTAVTYIKPLTKHTDAKQVMLILPSEGGTAISYSNGQVEFIRNIKRH